MSRTRREFIKVTTAAGAMFEVVGASGLEASQSGHTIPFPTQRAKAVMEMFGLKYPIFEAPHGLATCPELAIAVSNAGAVGTLALTRFTPKECVRPFQRCVLRLRDTSS